MSVPIVGRLLNWLREPGRRAEAVRPNAEEADDEFAIPPPPITSAEQHLWAERGRVDTAHEEPWEFLLRAAPKPSEPQPPDTQADGQADMPSLLSPAELYMTALRHWVRGFASPPGEDR